MYESAERLLLLRHLMQATLFIRSNFIAPSALWPGNSLLTTQAHVYLALTDAALPGEEAQQRKN
jgi:hypothetical protein